MAEARIPVYLITGFLDSGKTSLLVDTLGQEYFADGQRTVILRCEEGEVAYDPQQLSQLNARLIPVEGQSQFTIDFLDEVDRRYQPQRVLLEYNGMWPMDLLRGLDMPLGWGLYQAIHVIDGSTFAQYRANLQSQLMDMVSEADLALFNRCTPDMPLAGWKRAIRATNPRAELVFEGADGDELEVEDLLPYDLEAPAITLADGDYGIWYLDVQEKPQRYLGKTVTFTAQVLHGSKLQKTQFIPGRNAMTCCEEDIRFFGFLCSYPSARTLKKGQWVTVTARVAFEQAPVYEGEGVVLYATSVLPAQRPEDPLVYFR